jgi:hypothetical protein
VLDAHAGGETEPVSIIKIGPELVFGRLWQDMGIAELISQLAGQRRYGFDLERAIYLTVLHRLFVSGSDRAAEAWKENYSIPGAEELALEHLYRRAHSTPPAPTGREVPARERTAGEPRRRCRQPWHLDSGFRGGQNLGYRKVAGCDIPPRNPSCRGAR